MKTYRLRSLAMTKGQNSFVELCLEFDGKRAFVVWDSVPVGHYQFKARLEIDPALLQKAQDHSWDYVYRGSLVLPRPEHN